MDSKETTRETSVSTNDKEQCESKPPTLERESTGSTTANLDNVEPERKHSVDIDEEDIKSKKRKLKDDQTKDESHGTKEEPAQKKDECTPKKEKEEHPKSKTSAANNTSPKSTTPHDDQDSEEDSNNSGPKVPPLKIVLPPAESEQNNRNGKNGSRHHPYVVSSNDDASTAASVVNSTASSPASPTLASKEKPPSPSLSTVVSSTSGNNATTSSLTSVEDQRSQQRVLRSAHNSKSATVSTSGVSSTSSSPTEAESSLQDSAQSKDEQKAKNDSVKNKDVNKGKLSENTTKVKTEVEEEPSKPTMTENKNANASHVKDEPSVEVHPRKRKFKAKPEPMDVENDHATAFGSAPHPHEVPVTNCYQMFMDIRRQIDVKRKGLFPIQPKPPQGFKDYLMNRRTYTLQKDSLTRFIRLNAEPPEGLPEALKEFFQEQESERYTLRMQHVVEKEKLVLSVEQEILRVHGRAARALANQALPFSACTILKDEEVYNVITPEQEEKDRNARSRYNGRLFISWLQDVDDKWEKIKEEMLARQRKEAESLNAVQKFNWDIKMRELGLWKKKESYPVEPNCVPTLAVNEEFDLIY